MYAQLVQQLPEGNDWLYEVKIDGYRCLAGRDARE
jgi:bifunctional non-homologous end joining protein LigD